jgi:hypothetical protein
METVLTIEFPNFNEQVIYFLREMDNHLRVIPLGGDQLTCERVRGAHRNCSDGDTAEERLEGCVAMIEDFHEKMNFLQVSNKC